MRQRTLLFICTVLLLSSGHAQAEALTLPQAIEVAQEKSPDLRQLENQVDSAAAKTRLALAPSEPTLAINFNDLRQQFNLGTVSSNSFQLTQPLGFPGRAFLNRSQLSDQEDALHYQLRSLKLQVSLNVKQAYYGLALALENMKLNEDTRLAYERISAIAKRRYETGLTSQVDYLNAQLALLSNRNDLTDLQSAERVARSQLNVLLKNPPDATLEVQPVQMVYHSEIKLDDAVAKMLENRNEIKSAQAQASASHKAYDLAWMSILPDFQLMAGTTFYRNPYASPLSADPELANQAAMGGPMWPTHTYMLGVQFTIPIWFMFNEREAIVGASHDRAAAEANLDVVYNQSKVALEQSVDAVNSLLTKIENFEKHMIPLSEQAFSLALINYSAGKIDFQTLSDTAASRRTIKLNYATAVVSYLTNYATYGQLIGEDL